MHRPKCIAVYGRINYELLILLLLILEALLHVADSCETGCVSNVLFPHLLQHAVAACDRVARNCSYDSFLSMEY